MVRLGYEQLHRESVRHQNGECQEQSVDEALQLNLHRDAAELRRIEKKRLGITVVLLTGDGADSQFNMGGFKDAIWAALQ
ncbi:hypothetical protein BOTBODRAFT_55011 [Botryobasidium botryosum FD-172 SS1]|uniref:Uncharacterized protein n=1 Tax=Botryobasidium botryosum (strain FD-172 SS1) TaxID=930990 RepID=A0A067MJA3_BOTB1|nr:hypothetical protein BOTBODRAFT_55011 [Botryobasidium botryosum FD-172 SS1]